MKRIDDIKEYLHGNRKGKAANHMERERCPIRSCTKRWKG